MKKKELHRIIKYLEYVRGQLSAQLDAINSRTAANPSGDNWATRNPDWILRTSARGRPRCSS
jgi:hypothetical protein